MAIRSSVRKFVLAAALAVVPSAAWAEYNTGVLAAMRGDHTVAHKELVRPAELGVTDAQFFLAVLCDTMSDTVPCGQLEAYVWYSIALARLEGTTVGRASLVRTRVAEVSKSLSLAERRFADQMVKDWGPSRHLDFTKAPRRPQAAADGVGNGAVQNP